MRKTNMTQVQIQKYLPLATVLLSRRYTWDQVLYFIQSPNDRSELERQVMEVNKLYPPLHRAANALYQQQQQQQQAADAAQAGAMRTATRVDHLAAAVNEKALDKQLGDIDFDEL